MLDIVRDAPYGQLARFLTGNKVFLYPEEQKDFQCPHCYIGPKTTNPTRHPSSNGVEGSGTESTSDTTVSPALDSNLEKTDDKDNLDFVPTNNSSLSHADRTSIRPSLEFRRTQTLPYTTERMEIEQELALTKTKSIPIKATETADGTVLVDWYSTDDPANPQNWSQKKKALVALQIDLYTWVVYCGSSIYVSSELGVMARFGVGETKAALGLALYVLGYGLGPLLFAPMSEIPAFGRNVPYVATFAVYLILAVPTALVENLGGLLVLRFLQGFFGSPCLANGGASMQDMYSILYLPYSVALWVSSMFAGPALGPTMSAFAVVAENWRWSLWEILWMASPIFIAWFFFLPETSASNILLRRAARLRKVSSNDKIRSQTEIDRKGITPRAIFMDAVVKPFEISIKDPAVLFTNVYTALTYGIYYSFFEVFPLVYGPLYGFNLGETGLVFLAIVMGCFLGMAIYFAYLHFRLIPGILNSGLRPQEWRLRPALPSVIVFTLSLFAFGWTANVHVHWIVSAIMLTIYSAAICIILQCIFVYIPMSYPQYAASLFASNDFCRSAFASGAVLFSRPMYLNLGIGQGISLLGGLSVLGIIGLWLLYFYGAKLRARSKFALG